MFGTRLSHVTCHLRQRDMVLTLERLGQSVAGWAGGTRIGACLHEFNRKWSRRLLAPGAVVVLMSDGLDRDGGKGIEAEIRRLCRSARKLIWLNPLLHYAGFEAKSSGIRAILPHVDEFRPVSNLNNLIQLSQAFVAADRSARR